MDEQRAIQQLKRGQLSGLEFLVSRSQVKAVWVAYLITRDLGLAENVVQDRFIQVDRSIPLLALMRLAHLSHGLCGM